MYLPDVESHLAIHCDAAKPPPPKRQYHQLRPSMLLLILAYPVPIHTPLTTSSEEAISGTEYHFHFPSNLVRDGHLGARPSSRVERDLSRHATTSGTQFSWTWLSAMNSVPGSYSSLSVNIPR
ncbi:hypothetical protein BS17DRAFT_429330 [Gyrodon lividus]|nr:hypothetical protein BS17DRAFT_429330 [Gyrodon lividus]